jgi:hypothetical protein
MISKKVFVNERRNTMKWPMKKAASVMLVVTVLSGVMWSGASNVWAQKKGGTLAKQIQGTWTLVSICHEQDGKKIEPYGPNPRGSMIFTPDDHFSMFFLRASLPKFASNNRMTGTAEENQAVVQGRDKVFEITQRLGISKSLAFYSF